MADTLSRKHRLKQRQEQQQQQQFARCESYGNGKENGRITLTTKNGSSSSSSGGERIVTAIKDNNDDDDDHDGFSVFQVVEVGTNTCYEREADREREEFRSTRATRKQLVDRSDHRTNQPLKSRRANSNHLKGDVNSVRNSNGNNFSSRQIERRNGNNFDHYEEVDADYNHHHQRRQQQQQWPRQTIYEVSSNNNNHPKQEQQQQQSSNFQNHATNGNNHYQSKSLSTLTGSFTTKSTGGNSSSGFSSSNGSYSSSSLQQQQQQHQQRSSSIQKDDCVAQVGTNNNNSKQQDRRGHERGMGKRSKLIDDLDRLLMPPNEQPGGMRGSGVGSMNRRLISADNNADDDERRRRSSLVSPTESYISTATTCSRQHLSSRHKVASNSFIANDTANDFDCSTLCRDEFSSFIQIELLAPKQTKTSQSNDSGCGGPMLVGIHETEASNNNRSNVHISQHAGDNCDMSLESEEIDHYDEFRPSPGQDDDGDDEIIYDEIPCLNSTSSIGVDQLSSPPIISTSPSCYSPSASAENPCSPIVCQNYSPEMITGDEDDVDNNDSYNNKSLRAHTEDTDSAIVYNQPQSMMVVEDKCGDLSRMLDIYVERVNSLIRLTKSDKSISIHEAFVFDDDDNDSVYRGCGQFFEVRAEHRTPVEFAPHCSKGRENSMRIIQEIEYEDEPTLLTDQRIEQEGEICRRRRGRIITHVKSEQDHRPLKSILESIQISPDLRWPHGQRHDNDCDIVANDLVGLSRKETAATDIRELEESLITRLGLSVQTDDNDGKQPTRSRSSVAGIIREHIREFIENYHTYQRGLSEETSFGDGSWHENWLFASKRPRSSHEATAKLQEVSGAKRARLGSPDSHAEGSKWFHEDQENNSNEARDACEKADLIKYSTLILAKCKPLKLTLAARDQDRDMSGEDHHYHRNHHKSEQHLIGLSDISSHIESLYETQLERVSELELVAIESSRQTDVCRLLLCDTDDDDDDDDDNDQDCGDDDTMDSNNNNRTRRPAAAKGSRNKSLLVSYDSTSLRPALNNASKFHFTASGYLFQTSLITFPIGSSELRAKLERKILNKLISSLDEQSKGKREATVNTTAAETTRLLVKSAERERARFVISLSNIELINRLPVIQFCAKISGSLPIRVRWFRQLPANTGEHHHNQQQQQQQGYEELSDISAAKRRNLNIRMVADTHSPWPIELQASYDYEYQTQSASWFRFKRNKDEILFEIREPNLDTDYNRVYKCSIENACSRKECKFELTTKRVVNSSSFNCDRLTKRLEVRKKATPRKAAATAASSAEEGHALLRTWSQRTLNKPQPSEPKVSADAEQNYQINYDHSEKSLVTAACSGRQQTVGRLSASSADEDKFGKNFPYHPENLLKRLEENKFSIPAKRKLAVTTGAGQHPSASMNDRHLAPCELLDSAELVWSDSKIPIDDEVVESYYPKQQQLQRPVREQLALANNSNNNNSGSDLAHAADSMQSDSELRTLVNYKENLSRGQEASAGCSGAEKVQQLGSQERPRRAVINPRRPLSRVDLADDSAGRLKATQQLDESTSSELKDNSKMSTKEITRNCMQTTQVPIQPPMPRLRLSHNRNKEQQEDQKENYRSNDHDQTNHKAATAAAKCDFIGKVPSETVNHSTYKKQDAHNDQLDGAAAAKLNGNDVDNTASQGGGTSAVSNHRKSGPNVKSLISRFSVA